MKRRVGRNRWRGIVEPFLTYTSAGRPRRAVRQPRTIAMDAVRWFCLVSLGAPSTDPITTAAASSTIIARLQTDSGPCRAALLAPLCRVHGGVLLHSCALQRSRDCLWADWMHGFAGSVL